MAITLSTTLNDIENRNLRACRTGIKSVLWNVAHLGIGSSTLTSVGLRESQHISKIYLPFKVIVSLNEIMN